MGSLLLVDPVRDFAAATDIFDVSADTAVLPLNDSSTLITALAFDALILRQRLDTGLASLG